MQLIISTLKGIRMQPVVYYFYLYSVLNSKMIRFLFFTYLFFCQATFLYGAQARDVNYFDIHDIESDVDLFQHFIDVSNTEESETSADSEVIKNHVDIHDPIPHSNKKKYPCRFDNCAKVFASLSTRVVHERIHTGKRPYTCECGKTFTDGSNFIKHKKIHKGIRDKICFCGKAFFLSSDLKRHQKVHSKDKFFICPLCKSEFKRKDNLLRHMRQVHSIK